MDAHADVHLHAHADRHPDGDGDVHEHPDPHAHVHTDRHRDPHVDADHHVHPDQDPDADVDPDLNPHPNQDVHLHGHTHRDRHTDADADLTATSTPTASATPTRTPVPLFLALSHRFHLGETWTGCISPVGNIDIYEFEAVAGSTCPLMWVKATSGNLIPYVALIDPDGITRIDYGEFTDEPGQQFEFSGVETFDLDKTGLWQIVIIGHNNTTGGYFLKTRGLWPKIYIKESGTIAAPGEEHFYYTGVMETASFAIQFTEIAGFDGLVQVRNADGVLIGSTTGSSLSITSAQTAGQTSGPYEIKVRGATPFATGSYDLRVVGSQPRFLGTYIWHTCP